MEIKNIEICSICLENILIYPIIEQTVIILGCFHVYHFKCIKPLIKSTHIKCCVCRYEDYFINKCEKIDCKFQYKKNYKNKKLCLIHYNMLLKDDIIKKKMNLQNIIENYDTV